MVIENQAEVLAFLSAPVHFPGVQRVHRIDTHTSAVFLAGLYAYKLKRAVRYDYLDYSTVQRRRDACEREMHLNRRTAPHLYLRVLPITRDDTGGLRLGGAGDPVDWVLVMRRFAQEHLFDRLAVSGRLRVGQVARAADIVAAFHQRAHRLHQAGGREALRAVIDGNAAALTGAGSILDQRQVAALNDVLEGLLVRHGETLDKRRDRGMVRECHGDLHLRNIVSVNRMPTLFDGIEFNDAFSCIDVMYDFAFLLMDLLARGLPEHANAAFNRYLRRTDDYEGLTLLPFFLGCRAAIRAKTSLAAAELAQQPRPVDDLRRRAASYVALAARVLQQPAPRLIAVGGFSGTGKSTLAARLAPALGAAPGAVLLRSDVLRRDIFVNDAPRPVPQWAYGAAGRRIVYSQARRQARRALNAGYVAVVDAVFGEQAERTAIEALAAELGVRFDGLWLEANLDVMENRIRNRRGDESDADVGVLLRQMQESSRYLSWRRIDASDTVTNTELEALRALEATVNGPPRAA